MKEQNIITLKGKYTKKQFEEQNTIEYSQYNNILGYRVLQAKTTQLQFAIEINEDLYHIILYEGNINEIDQSIAKYINKIIILH